MCVGRFNRLRGPIFQERQSSNCPRKVPEELRGVQGDRKREVIPDEGPTRC
jgi:hypothetical protein